MTCPIPCRESLFGEVRASHQNRGALACENEMRPRPLQGQSDLAAGVDRRRQYCLELLMISNRDKPNPSTWYLLLIKVNISQSKDPWNCNLQIYNKGQQRSWWASAPCCSLESVVEHSCFSASQSAAFTASRIKGIQIDRYLHTSVDINQY